VVPPDGSRASSPASGALDDAASNLVSWDERRRSWRCRSAGAAPFPLHGGDTSGPNCRVKARPAQQTPAIMMSRQRAGEQPLPAGARAGQLVARGSARCDQRAVPRGPGRCGAPLALSCGTTRTPWALGVPLASMNAWNLGVGAPAADHASPACRRRLPPTPPRLLDIAQGGAPGAVMLLQQAGSAHCGTQARRVAASWLPEHPVARFATRVRAGVHGRRANIVTPSATPG
jgi:hypothetical protein